MKRLTPLFLIAALTPPAAHARSSTACFKPEEVLGMVQKRDAVSKAASECLKKYWDTHNAFFRQNKYSRYYGVLNKSLNTPEKRKKILLKLFWPDFERTLRPDEAAAFRAATGLNEFDTYYQQKNPVGFNDYKTKIARFQLEVRTTDEKAPQGYLLRPNTTLLAQNISCVDMTRRCLSEGFISAGMRSTWEKVDAVTMTPDRTGRPEVSGVKLQKALSDLGWKILFWNPDPSQNAAFDADDRQIKPLEQRPAGQTQMVWQGAWGGHASRYKGVMEKDEYFLGSEAPLIVDDKKLLVGFGQTVPAQFAAVPFWVGTAHSGYHVFPGFSGKIIEAHSMRALTGIDNLQVSTFNPLKGQSGGGPVWTQSEHYRSGAIAVPPGYLDDLSRMRAPGVDEEGCVDLHPEKTKKPIR